MATAREHPLSWRDKDVILHADGRARCPWAGRDPLYVAYHDEEWGRPEKDARALYEKLVLDGFQAGLSWIAILRKREAFRVAFEGFAPERVARFDARRVAALMKNADIVRNRAKIEGAVASARAWLAIEQAQGFSAYLWDFVDGRPIVNHPRRMSDIPAQTELSKRLSRDLKARGFAFCGPTTAYAFMQAVGMVDDHLAECHRGRAGEC
ncbi:MAG: DNA-3-methyladenine glycosylase I [Methylocystis sp.]|nr:DNA-3-methyladenine glycosylase I [Methylocystis sp.]MBI3275044.1 DNA-3-methyladenine glycosylase I [Methylocystis sp.]